MRNSPPRRQSSSQAEDLRTLTQGGLMALQRRRVRLAERRRALLDTVRPRLAAGSILLAAGASLVAPGLAGAAGTPVTIGPGSPDWKTGTALAVNASGTAYIAWVDPAHTFVDYCVLPSGAS